jgi:hypothetical protein
MLSPGSRPSVSYLCLGVSAATQHSGLVPRPGNAGHREQSSPALGCPECDPAPGLQDGKAHGMLARREA